MGILGFTYLRNSMKTKDYNSVDWNEVFVEDSSSPTGLRWKIRPAQCAKAGDVAGSFWINKRNDRQCFHVMFKRTTWLVHRILWVMRNGSIDASLDVDHIDGNSLNNSVDNLRLVSTSINNRNHKQRKNNSSGVTGVCFGINERGTTYAVTSWCNLTGKRGSKSFSCDKLGLLPAFAAACAYREKMMEQLNASGAEYSDRHGLLE
jgi:HNH endonuclease/AP2 domain